MDIRAISQLSGASTGSAAAVSVPADTRALISDVASATTLTDAERGGILATAAAIDSGLTGEARTSSLQQLQQLGIYLRNTGNDGFPRWSMMTALRAYGMNLTAENGGSAAAASSVQVHIQQLVQARGVSVDTAVAAAAAYVAPVVVRQAPAPVVAAPAAPVVEAPKAVSRVETVA